MGKYEKLLDKILRGTSDRNIDFPDFCLLLIKLGFIASNEIVRTLLPPLTPPSKEGELYSTVQNNSFTAIVRESKVVIIFFGKRE